MNPTHEGNDDYVVVSVAETFNISSRLGTDTQTNICMEALSVVGILLLHSQMGLYSARNLQSIIIDMIVNSSAAAQVIYNIVTDLFL